GKALNCWGSGGKEDFVTIFKETPFFARLEPNRILPPTCRLEEATEAGCVRPGDRARTKEITRLKIAAVRCMVSDELCYGPVHVPRAAESNAMRRQTFLAQTGGHKKDRKVEVERSFTLIPIIP